MNCESGTGHSNGGRRLYGLDDVLSLQQIVFYKGFGFPLDEIRQNENIPINVVIAILSATRQDDFFAFVMKRIGREDLEALVSTVELVKEPDNDWAVLLMRLKELHLRGVDPLGTEGAQLASDWWDNVMHLTGDDPNLISSVFKAGADISGWPEEAGDIKVAIQEFLSPALGNFFMQKGIVPPGMEV